MTRDLIANPHAWVSTETEIHATAARLAAFMAAGEAGRVNMGEDRE